MAFFYGFYNSLHGDRRYDAIQMSKIFDGIIGDGVYETVEHALTIRASSVADQVIVQPGRAWFDHTWNYNDADLPIDASLSDILLDRYDAIVIDIQSDEQHRENQLLWVTGTASSDPQKPEMIKEEFHTQYPLAYVYRRANTEIINQADIENTVGTEECPFVTGIIDTISIDDLLLQWKAQWGNWVENFEAGCVAWWAAEQEEIEDWEDLSQEQFAAWFERMEGQLSEDAAGNLQRQIDEITYVYVQDNVLYLPGTFASVSDGILTLGTNITP